MDASEEFAIRLLEEAKRFLERYREGTGASKDEANLHAALLLGFCAFEAQINNVAADFVDRKEFDLLEKSLLAERVIDFEKGHFVLTKRLQIYRLEDRYDYLYRRFKGKALDRGTKWWGNLKAGLNLRNQLTHPRDAANVREVDVENALAAILKAIDVLFMAVYKKNYPPVGRQLDSVLEF